MFEGRYDSGRRGLFDTCRLNLNIECPTVIQALVRSQFLEAYKIVVVFASHFGCDFLRPLHGSVQLVCRHHRCVRWPQTVVTPRCEKKGEDAFTKFSATACHFYSSPLPWVSPNARPSRLVSSYNDSATFNFKIPMLDANRAPVPSSSSQHS